MTLGRWAEAEEEVLIARALDPLSALLHGDVAMLYFYTQDAVALLEASERLLTLEPENRLAPSLKLQSLSWLGRWEDYRSQASLLLKGAPWLDAAQGPELDKRYLEARLEQWSAAQPSPTRAILLASLTSELGRPAEALKHLREAIRLRSTYLPFVPVDPHFRTLRGDPEFERALREARHPLFTEGIEVASGETKRNREPS
jgi:tetratricopeptide (TPR) repeat protein